MERHHVVALVAAQLAVREAVLVASDNIITASSGNLDRLQNASAPEDFLADAERLIAVASGQRDAPAASTPPIIPSDR